ncbi:MAG: NAD-dependent epimerase/dehydratase family protein [Dehalococcoidia bacterium]|nr:NAD-dependent epimerase/dehydratase family protein [Dehalococcoidia bacterium]
MKALVTGATGFLGSHIVDRLLERGDGVRALVRAGADASYLGSRDVELVPGDITRPGSLPAAVAGADIVYHAAANVTDWDPWRRFQDDTIAGTRNLLQASVAAGVPRFLHISTDGVYALGALSKGITEDSRLERRFGWLDYYRRAKLAAEKIARRGGGRIAVAIVRPGLLLGERDRAVLPGVVAFLKSRSAMYLGDPGNRLPYVYAGDVAAACVLAATNEQAAGRIYNVVSDEHVTQRDLLGAVAEATGLRPPRRSAPFRAAYGLATAMEAWGVLRGRRRRPELTRFGVNLLGLDYQEDASRIGAELGWQAEVPMREAVRRSVEWAGSRRPQRVGG